MKTLLSFQHFLLLEFPKIISLTQLLKIVKKIYQENTIEEN